MVTLVFQLFDFLQGAFVHFVQSAIWMYAGMRVTFGLETFRAAVPQTPVKFVHRGTLCDGISFVVPIN